MTLEIPTINLDRLIEEIALMNRRANRLKVAPVTMTYVTEGRKTTVTIEGVTPVLPGDWKLVAAIERQENGENTVFCVPGMVCPTEYRTTDSRCDHCNTRRIRSQVFVVSDGQAFKQVGRSCIRDFLGGYSPEELLARAEWSATIGEAGDSEEWGGMGRAAVYVDDFLNEVVACVNAYGWVSRKDAGITNQATADTAWDICTNPIARKESAKDLDGKYNTELAAKALEYGRGLGGDTDYVYNLGVACRQEVATYKNKGIIASVVSAYMRHIEQEIKRAERLKAEQGSVYVGEVKKRQLFTNLRAVMLRTFDSEFGVRTMIKFRDEQGNVLVWWTGSTDIEQNQVFSGKATVKAHSEYQGVKQTIINRFTWEQVSS